MSDRLFAICEPCPTGFTFCPEFRRLDFRKAPFALYASTMEAACSFLGGELQRMACVILIPGDQLDSEEIAPFVTKMTILPAMIPYLGAFARHQVAQLEKRWACEDQRVFLALENARFELNTQRATEEFSHFRNSLLREVGVRRTAEMQRVASDEMLRLILSSTGEAIYGVNNAGICTFANEACLKQLGYEHLGEVLGRNMHDLIHNCTREGQPLPMQKCRIMEALSSGGRITCSDEVFRKRDGTIIPVEYSSYPIRKGGEVVGGVVTWRDITERKRAEEALRASEAKLSALFTSMTEMVVLHELICNEEGEPVNYRITDCNEAYTKVAGIAREAAVGRLANEVYGTDEPPYLREFSQVALSGESYHFETYFPPMRKFFSISVVRPQENCFATITTDITERRATLDALRLKNFVFDVSLAANSIADLKGTLTEANAMFLKLWGYSSKSDVIGKPILDFLNDPQDVSGIIRALDEAGQWEGDYTAKKQDGSTFIAHGMATTIRSETNEVIGYQSSVIDITERKRAEAELLKAQKLTSIGLLAGGIAHDFNNILMGLFGYITLAKKTLSHDHPALMHLEKTEMAMMRASRLTKQLLTFAKGGDPITEDVSLGPLIEEVVRFDLTESNVELVYQPMDDLWMAKADKAQIQQVISNLTINARQAMLNGGHLYITVANEVVKDHAIPLLRPGNYLKVIVRDEGSGIDPNTLDRIFDPYFTTKRSGSGLGLAITYSIIQKHGGHIGVSSKLGEGTTFTLHIPASNTRDIPRPASDIRKPVPFTRTHRVLVLDDEELIRMIIPRWLHALNCEVTVCEEGRHAVELYKRAKTSGAPYNLLILDLTIPGGMGGYEVFREIQSVEPAVKVIVSSGYAEGPIMANYESYGFRGVLAKPYTEEQLLELVTQVLA